MRDIKEFWIFVLTVFLVISNLFNTLFSSTIASSSTRETINKQWEIKLVKEGTHFLEEKDGILVLTPYPKDYPIIEIFYGKQPKPFTIRHSTRFSVPAKPEDYPPPPMQETNNFKIEPSS